MSKLKEGETDNGEFHRCSQTQCGYYQNGGCKACKSCGSEPFEIRDSCQTCFDCENVPDAIRFGEQPREKVYVPVPIFIEKQEDKVVISMPVIKNGSN